MTDDHDSGKGNPFLDADADTVASDDQIDATTVASSPDDARVDATDAVPGGEAAEPEDDPLGDVRVLLDDTTFGAVKQNEYIKSWEIKGLTRGDKGSTAEPAYKLANHPPKLIFKSFRDPDTEEYSIYLDRQSARQLHDALGNVVAAYESRPLKVKKRKWSFHGFLESLRISFEDNPVQFVFKIVGAVVIVALLLFAVLR